VTDWAPDVVHFHSLQSIGAGLLPVAKETGARVAVTMHDYWWLCSRQFLVDQEMRPCCLVPAAGECPCQVSATWRTERAAALAVLLGAADLVLAPSASMAGVLTANGVAPGRLVVDENGLPPETLALFTGERGRLVAPRTTADDRPIRVLYAGGPNPMKGVEVLLDAVEQLAGRSATPGPNWRLSAYGIGEYLEKSGRSVAGLPVDVLDPFEPSTLPEVLAAHDALVLPSVARESYSLLTRESLAAGVPVVCTDTLGPEEVVVHGTNGLVVAAGDAGALASTIGRLIDEPGLLERLTSGAATPVTVRSLADQVEGLEARFAALMAPGVEAGVERGVEDPPPPVAVRSVLFVCGIEGAPLRYRARLPAEALAGLGVQAEVRHYRDPELPTLGRAADVVVLYRVPATVAILDLIAGLRRAAIPTAFDVDDLIFDPDIVDEVPALGRLSPAEAELYLQGVNRYRTTLDACDAYIGSTAMLVDRAAGLTGLPTHRFANGVGFVLARRADRELRRPRRPGPLRIGYLSGTTTHDDDWFWVEPAVIEVLERHPTAELWLGGHLPDSPALARFGSRVVRLPFMDWLELATVLRDLDVNLSPLAPGGRFNEAKSAIKWLEAALCATPTVASPTEPFREAVVDGESGLLAETGDEWVAALDRLLSDEGERARIGGLARRRALLEWAPARQGARYLAILTDIVAAGVTDRSHSTWEPVAPDEPPIPVTLEPYGEVDDPIDPATTATTAGPPHGIDRIVGLARRVLASVQRDGLVATGRKGIAKVRARLQGGRTPN
jgi:glycosyltransferase involved in cell wall biosynthesis